MNTQKQLTQQILGDVSFREIARKEQSVLIEVVGFKARRRFRIMNLRNQHTLGAWDTLTEANEVWERLY